MKHTWLAFSFCQMSFALTPDLLQKILPAASKTNVTFAVPHFDKAMKHYGIIELKDMAAFFANVAVESASLKDMKERGGSRYLNDMYDTRTDLGNTPEKDGDGEKWAGHGYIQVTGYHNHMQAAKEFGKKPEEIAAWLQTHAGAAWSACWYWKSRSLSAIMAKPDMWRGNRGRFKGLDPFTYCCVAVNGGLTHINERRSKYEVAKKALGI